MGWSAALCELRTVAEISGWKKTGRYSEVESLARCFERRFPGKIRKETFGLTPEGRPMIALVVSEGAKSGGKSKAKKPVVFFQGGIHAGEIDGKDAGFWVLREVLQQKALPKILEKITFVFVPVFNVDGHERYGAYHRPNQNGPEEMGWRTTAQNYNLNRDFMKVDSPEMEALLKLLAKWDPMLAIDLHVTDGADFQVDVSAIVEPRHTGLEPLRAQAQELSATWMLDLKKSGHTPFDVYPSFREDGEPSSGFEAGMASARMFHGYWAQRQRLAVLIETHSWKDYATRVLATRDSLLSLLKQAQFKSAQWIEAEKKADALMAGIGGKEFALSYEPTGKHREILFPGYAYRREKSEISGVEEIIYDPAHKEEWKVPLYEDLAPKNVVRAPDKGYIIPSAWAKAISEKLNLHGIKFEVWKTARAEMEVSVLRVNDLANIKTSERSYEGHFSQSLKKGEWKKEKRQIPAGSLFVPIDQAKSALVLRLFEPQSGDSFFAQGSFLTSFEPKEYMENYMVHRVGQEMLAKDLELKARFMEKLKKEPEFAKSPELRREFFYRLHPSWDERLGLMPVYRY